MTGCHFSELSKSLLCDSHSFQTWIIASVVNHRLPGLGFKSRLWDVSSFTLFHLKTAGLTEPINLHKSGSKSGTVSHFIFQKPSVSDPFSQFNDTLFTLFYITSRWECSATNSLNGMPYTASKTITFEVGE